MSTNCTSEKQIASRDLPRQPRRGLPRGVKRIVERTEISIPDGYIEWATSFALLDEDGMSRASLEAANELAARGWMTYPFVDWSCRVIGRDCLRITIWTFGALIECCRASGAYTDILTIENMPVISCNGRNSMELAERCYLQAEHPFRWFPCDEDYLRGHLPT
jgi:hypothetical protein